jgi:hypothetical protein
LLDRALQEADDPLDPVVRQADAKRPGKSV